MKEILSIFIFTCLLFSGFASDIEEELSRNALKAEAFFHRGNDRYDAGNYEAAIKDFDKAIEIDAKFVDKYMPRLRRKAYNLRGNAKFKSKLYVEAIKDYDKSIALDPKCPWVYYNRARANAKTGHYKNAIKDYTTIIKLMPDDDFAYYMRGNIKTEIGDYKEAVSDYNKAIKIDPYYFEAYCKRGDAEFDLEQYHKAIKTYKKAMRLRRNNQEALNGINKVKDRMDFIATKWMREKLQQTDIKLISDKAAVYYNPGIPKKKSLMPVKTKAKKKSYASLYFGKDMQKFKPRKLTVAEKREKIIADYIRSLEADYKRAGVYNEIGLIKFDSGRNKEAGKYFNKAIKLAPMMPDGYHNRGNVRFDLGDYMGARKDFLKAKELAERQKNAEKLKVIEANIKELDKVEKKISRQKLQKLQKL